MASNPFHKLPPMDYSAQPVDSTPPNTGFDMFKHGAPTSTYESRLNDPLGTSMQYSAWQAQVDRDYNTEMSNTAYQRAVADMRKAGLNPYLAYSQGGASTPLSSGARVSASNSYAYENRKLDLESRKLDIEQDKLISDNIFSAFQLGAQFVPHYYKKI